MGLHTPVIKLKKPNLFMHMKLVVSIIVVVIVVAVAVLLYESQNRQAPQQTPQQVTYVGNLLAVVVDCAPSAQDCKPRTEFYLAVDNKTLPLDLTNATIQIPLNEYVGKPDKRVKVAGVLEGGVLKATLVTAP